MEKGLDEVPCEEEAIRFLEERKRVHIPDDSQRVIPSKKRESRKKKSGKERKRKRDSPSHGESAAKRASLDTIHTVGGRGDIDSPGRGPHLQ